MQDHTHTFEQLAAELDRANRRYQEFVKEFENRECDDDEFNPVCDARLDAEDALLDCRAESFEQLVRQVAILKRRAAGGFEISADVAKIATALLQPGSLIESLIASPAATPATA